MRPWHQTPSTAQPAEVPRQAVVIDALNTTASPNGWVADGASPETVGNNVDAYADTDGNNNNPELPRPNGGATRTFDFPLDLSQAPSSYREASIVQLFYVNNWLHDRLYELGFTETSRNFQTDNFGRSGLGNDAVRAEAQDGGGTNNANFSTPVEGSPPRMQMFLFTAPHPDRDSTLENETVVHEYVHGLSNRLVGGGVGIQQTVPRGMGEGWSDFYAVALLATPEDDPDHAIASGAYITYLLDGIEDNYYFGIRRYPYSPDKSKNPLTLQDVVPTKARLHDGIPLSKSYTYSNNNPTQVHAMGEVWCNVLIEVRRLLIHKHGFATGNELILQLVTDGMKLSPQNPTFTQARDAIIQADLAANEGDNIQAIWDGFAKRGFGLSAVNLDNWSTWDAEEAYDTPGDMEVTPVIAFEATGTLGATKVPGGKQAFRLKKTAPPP